MNYPELDNIRQGAIFQSARFNNVKQGVAAMGNPIFQPTQKHSHYKKDVSHLQMVDVYRVIDLWEIKHPALQHALKKILAAGKRGAKDEAKDIQEAIDSLERWKEMQAEDAKS